MGYSPYRFIVFHSLFLIVMSGCNKSSESSHRRTVPVAPDTKVDETADANPQIQNQTTDSSAIYKMVDAAVVSTFSVQGGREVASIAPGQLSLGSAALVSGPECTETATPKDALNGVPWPPVHKDFAAGRFYCLMSFNSYTPSSVQGAYTQNKGFLCLVNKALKGVFSGKATPVTIDFSDGDCFDDDFRTLYYADGLPPAAEAMVTASKPSTIEPDKWDSSIVIVMPADLEAGTVSLLFKTTESGVATAALFDQSTEKKESYSLSLDTKGGILRIDARNYRWGDGDKERNEHYRIYAQGTVDGEGNFTKLGRIEGIDSVAFNMDPDKEIRMHSLKMDFAKGGRTNHRTCSTSGGCTDVFDMAQYTTLAGTDCYPGDGGADSCEGVTPIDFAGSAGPDFSLVPGGASVQKADIIFKAGPLTFNAVNAAGLLN